MIDAASRQMFDLSKRSDQEALKRAADGILNHWKEARQANPKYARRVANRREAADKKATECSVYVIGHSLTGPIKIGFAKNPQNRIRELQTGHPRRLINFGNRWVASDLARRIEGECHRRLRSLRQSGEWFDTTASHAKAIIEEVAAAFEA